MSRSFRLAAVLCALAPAAALGQAASSAPPAGAPPADPMAAWAPRKLTPAQEKQAGKQLHQLFAKMEQAGQKADLDAAAALIDFPVLMLTDNKAGDAVGEPWSEEQWRKVMAPMYASPPPKDMRMTNAPKIFFLSDTLASVDNVWTMAMGKKKTTGRSSMLVMRKGGEWKIKAMVESGWGDMPAPGAAEEKAAEPAGGK